MISICHTLYILLLLCAIVSAGPGFNACNPMDPSHSGPTAIWAENKTGEEILTLSLGFPQRFAAALSSDGQQIAVASVKGINVCNSSTGNCLPEVGFHSNPPHGVVWLPGDHDVLYIGGRASFLVTGQSITGCENYVGSLQEGDNTVLLFLPKRWNFVVGTWIGNIRLWKPQQASEVNYFYGHSGPVLALAVSPDEQTILTGSVDYTARVWHIDSKKLLLALYLNGNVSAVAYTADGSSIITFSEDGFLSFWSLPGGDLLRRITLDGGCISPAAFSPDRHQIVCSDANFAIQIYNVDTGASLYTLEGHTGYLYSLSYSASGDVFISASSDGTVKMWHSKAFDCKAGDWSDWGPCLCHSNQSRSRTVLMASANGGAACPPLEEFRGCYCGLVILGIVLGVVGALVTIAIAAYLISLLRKQPKMHEPEQKRMPSCEDSTSVDMSPIAPQRNSNRSERCQRLCTGHQSNSVVPGSMIMDSETPPQQSSPESTEMVSHSTISDDWLRSGLPHQVDGRKTKRNSVVPVEGDGSEGFLDSQSSSWAMSSSRAGKERVSDLRPTYIPGNSSQAPASEDTSASSETPEPSCCGRPSWRQNEGIIMSSSHQARRHSICTAAAAEGNHLPSDNTPLEASPSPLQNNTYNANFSPSPDTSSPSSSIA